MNIIENNLKEVAMGKNSAYQNSLRMKDKRALLSTLWIFVVLNYLYCDVLSLMDSNLLKQYLTGVVGGMHMTPGFLLGASILMEISIAMVILSRILNYTANRLANIIAGLITTIVQIASLFLGKPSSYYIFFSAIEISSTFIIFLIALKWSTLETQS
jgi:hypothetical protein